MIPLKDDNPTRSAPIVTLFLVAINLVVFLWQVWLPEPARQAFILGLAIIPDELTRLQPFNAVRLAHGGTTLLTSMFVHGSLLHLGGNLLYLWIFGNNVEDVTGHGRFLLFYLLSGLAAAATQIAAAPGSTVPMLGASGAIAGVLGAYLVLFPDARVHTLIFIVVFVRVVPVPAVILLGVWLLIQMVNAGSAGGAGIAWFAHLGGFGAGLLLISILRRRRPRHSLY